MADKLELQVITPSSLVINEEVDEVVAPGELGEFGVLPGHVAFITLLMPGELRYRKEGSERKLIVWGGVSEVRDDKVTVLTDNVEDPVDINTEAARREAEAILEELKNFSGNPKELKELNRRLKLAQVRAGVGVRE
ncbi:MAG: ATP synthase F1 subunit epsilon [Deltaproteobacteria bacterium]|nr:ATP synthase F1 subunit epsilon [Deltaproteobacteria bacterium]